METDQAFLEYVVKQIVTSPDKVEVTRTIDDLGVLITLKVDKEDMGRIIGKEGQTAKALRTLLRVIGSRNNLRVNMKILEPEGGMGEFVETGHAPSVPSSEMDIGMGEGVLN